MGNPIPAPPADASATRRGLVSTGTQTFAGNKTFSGTLAASNLSGTNTGDVTLGTANGLSLAGQALSLAEAVASGSAGALSGSDKAKLDAISGTNTGDMTLAAFGSTPNASGASLSGQALTLQPADGSNPGLLSTTAQTIAGAKTFSSEVILSTGELESGVGNGASAVGFALDTTNSLSTSGAKLLSLKNAGTEKSYFGKDGALTISGVANGSNAIVLPGSGTASARILFTDSWLDKWIGLSNGLIQVNGGLYSSGALYVASSGISTWSTSTLPIVGGSADGASAVGIRLSSKVAYSTAGAKLVSIRNDTTEKLYVDKDGGLTIAGAGKINFSTAGDSSGTPGNATINQPAGKSTIASGATTIVITNSLAATTSKVMVSWREDPGDRFWVTYASGSFTVNLATAAGSDLDFDWILFN